VEAGSDAQLMEWVQKGDRQAFAAIVDRYKERLVAYLTRLCGNGAQAEDLAQETFLKLYLKAANYDERQKLGGYLYKMATHLAFDHHRRNARRRLLSHFMPAKVSVTLEGNPQRAAELSETQQRIKSAIDALSMKFRIPLVLHDMEGMTQAEIAKITGQKIGTIKSRLSRARASLRSELADLVEA